MHDLQDEPKYQRDFEGTPVFTGTAPPDLHVLIKRGDVPSDTLKEKRTNGTMKIHEVTDNILPDHIRKSNEFIFHPDA